MFIYYYLCAQEQLRYFSTINNNAKKILVVSVVFLKIVCIVNRLNSKNIRT